MLNKDNMAKSLDQDTINMISDNLVLVDCPYPIGEALDTTGLRKLILDSEVLSHIYVPVEVYTNGECYFVTENGILLMMGYIDTEGVEGTVTKDFTTLPSYYNFVIAIMKKDFTKVQDIAANDSSNLIEHFLLGEQYRAENHPNV